MDREFGAIVADDRHDLEEVRIASRPEVQARVVFLVGDAVLARRRVNVHGRIVLRNPVSQGHIRGHNLHESRDNSALLRSACSCVSRNRRHTSTRIAHSAGGRKVAGSNPVAPIPLSRAGERACGRTAAMTSGRATIDIGTGAWYSRSRAQSVGGGRAIKSHSNRGEMLRAELFRWDQRTREDVHWTCARSPGAPSGDAGRGRLSSTSSARA